MKLMKASFKDMTSEEKAREKRAFTVRLAKRIRAVRESKSISQEQLSDRAGYYRTYVGHIENATKSPSAHTVWRIAQALDVKVEELFKNL
jgi:transcriptional regulator with XRE-family HTH domain